MFKNLVNRLCPFIWEKELRKLYLDYKYAPDDEIDYKLNVCRGKIFMGEDTEHYERKSRVYWKIRCLRERIKRRRASIDEWRGWLGLARTSIGFGAGLAAVPAWKWIASLIA